MSARIAGAPIEFGDVALRLPRAMRWFGAAHALLLHRSAGRAGSRWFGAGVLALETVGRRSGARRMAAVVFVPDGDNLVVVPANAGGRSPAWWLNLQAAGGGIAHLAHERRPVRAREADGPERERLWRRHAAVAPVDHYEHRSSRLIPVVVLERRCEEVRSRPV